MYSAAHNSYTSLDSDFVRPQNKRSCSCIIFRGILTNLPSIDFGHLNFKLFWTRIQLAPCLMWLPWIRIYGYMQHN